MPFHIKDPDTDKMVRELAAMKGLSLTQTVRNAAANELKQLEDVRMARRAAIARVQARAAACAGVGLAANKAFFDDLHDGL